MKVKIINNLEMPAFAALPGSRFQAETRVFTSSSFSSSSSNKPEFEDEDEKDCLPPVSSPT
jgi:hypothetical protein